MQNLRTYGKPPFSVAAIHGGPGAGGEMAPMAKELAGDYGVLEPIQTAITLEGQVQELRQILETHAQPPVTLIGFSWGAWLSLIVATRYPVLIKKLVLAGCGPLEEKHVPLLQKTRLNRLDAGEKNEFEKILKALNNPAAKNKNLLLNRLGQLASKSDNYDALPDQTNEKDRIRPRGDIFQNVWEAAAKLRKSGKLLELAGQVQCPVVAIHGAYDPHPAEGVEKPLSAVLKNFRFVVLEKCGHTPWLERQAHEKFYQVLKTELT